MGFHIEPGLRARHRAQAAAGYWQAFSRKLRLPLGPEPRATQFLETVLDGSFAMSAVDDDGAFLGCAGFKTPDGAMVGGGFGELARIYGTFGALWRVPLLMLLERPCMDGTLLMDGIFVQPEARGMGVGTALLTAIEAYAAAQGLTRIRLDVIDENPRAKALYERQGFTADDRMEMGPLRHLVGFGGATTMVKALAGTG